MHHLPRISLLSAAITACSFTCPLFQFLLYFIVCHHQRVCNIQVVKLRGLFCMQLHVMFIKKGRFYTSSSVYGHEKLYKVELHVGADDDMNSLANSAA